MGQWDQSPLEVIIIMKSFIIEILNSIQDLLNITTETISECDWKLPLYKLACQALLFSLDKVNYVTNYF